MNRLEVDKRRIGFVCYDTMFYEVSLSIVAEEEYSSMDYLNLFEVFLFSLVAIILAFLSVHTFWRPKSMQKCSTLGKTIALRNLAALGIVQINLPSALVCTSFRHGLCSGIFL